MKRTLTVTIVNNSTNIDCCFLRSVSKDITLSKLADIKYNAVAKTHSN